MPGVRDIDHGYSATVKRVFGFQKARISSGILEAAGQQTKQPPLRQFHYEAPLGEQLAALFGDAGATGEEAAVTLIEVACWNEFGTEDIPARSFIRDWFDERQEVIRGWLFNLMTAVIQGRRTKEQALELLGQQCAASIQARMAAGGPYPPPGDKLADSTIKRKGSSIPLIDTGQLRSSVSYRVEPDIR